MKKRNRVIFSVCLPPHYKEAFTKIADNNYMTRSALLRQWIDKEIKRNEKNK